MTWFWPCLDHDVDEVPEPSGDGNRVSLDISRNVDDESMELREDSDPNGDITSDKGGHLNCNTALEMFLVTSSQ
jgi:hypothetical protein